MFYDIFLKLCVSKRITPSRAAGEMGFSKTAVTNWKSGAMPRDFALVKIADYFGVTVDYLLGKEQEKKPSETEELEDVKVALFGGNAEVTPEMWEEVKQFARFLALKKQQEKK